MNRKKRIIILGGLGFIGRNLYNSLTKDNSIEVTLLADRIHQDQARYLDPAVRKNIIVGSILDKEFVEHTLRGYDVVFSMAGRSGASDSIKNPYYDLDTNLKGHLNILEACRKSEQKPLVIFPSSRLVYGKPHINPVTEDHPLMPESIYAIHKITTEHYYLLYQRLHQVNCIIYRISNPFGPYQRFGSNNYGILNWFIHKALSGETIEIYGEGDQKRDFIYVDDVVDVLKRSIDDEKMIGKIYNIGYGKGISIKEAVNIIARYIPDTKIKFRPWPEIDKIIETGDYISDLTRVKKDSGWEPATSFDEGVKKTIEFYERESK